MGRRGDQGETQWNEGAVPAGTTPFTARSCRLTLVCSRARRLHRRPRCLSIHIGQCPKAPARTPAWSSCDQLMSGRRTIGYVLRLLFFGSIPSVLGSGEPIDSRGSTRRIGGREIVLLSLTRVARLRDGAGEARTVPLVSLISAVLLSSALGYVWGVCCDSRLVG